MVSVPNNWTNYFQPLDLTVNKSSKDFLRDEAQTWYSNEIAKQMSEGKRTDQIKVDVRLSVVKPLHGLDYQILQLRPEPPRNNHQWLEKVWYYRKS